MHSQHCDDEKTSYNKVFKVNPDLGELCLLSLQWIVLEMTK